MISRPAAEIYLRSVAWALLAVLATVIGVYSLRYALPHVPMPAVTNFVTRRVALTIHAVFASVALLVGPWQFLPRLRARRPDLHRILGRTYVVAVLVGWLASIPVGLHAQTGPVASAGFLALGVCWITSTVEAVVHVLRGEIAAHRRWMIRSYALTAAAITLRLYLGLVAATHIPFVPAYTAIAWLCWVPNLAVVELAFLWSGRTRQKPQQPSPAAARPG